MIARAPTIKLILLFTIVFVLVAAWVTMQDGEGAATARSFLRHFARAIF